MKDLTEQEATAFFSEFYFGEHHIPGYKVSPCGYGFSVNHDRGCLATFDYDELTRLVLMAHRDCIRVEISAARNNIIKISIHKREREGTVSERHPTIDQVLNSF
jgi:hypothetical protein